MTIYRQVRLGATPEINAVSTILIGIVTLGVLAAAIFTKRQTDRLEKERRLAFGAAG
jgi:putrescine transport system permease protein